MQKNEETEKTKLAELNRAKKVSAFGASIKLHAISDIPVEVEANRSLGILIDSFKSVCLIMSSRQSR